MLTPVKIQCTAEKGKNLEKQATYWLEVIVPPREHKLPCVDCIVKEKHGGNLKILLNYRQ